MSTHGLIAPHGGSLVNLVVDKQHAPALQVEAAKLPAIKLGEREQCDLELLAIGGFSPLNGFMGAADFQSVCSEMALTTGLPWSVPILCPVAKATADGIAVGSRVALTDDAGRILGVLTVNEKFAYDKKLECEKVFKTHDTAHPGVAVTLAAGDVCLGGPVEALTPRHEPEFAQHRLTPAQTRAAFSAKGWQTVVAFQTRNPIHRAHEYLTKCALEMVDGLLIHPLVGQTQKGDIPADVRMKCYEVLLANYYNAKHTLLSVLPAAMRYAGPREAIHHALMRKNYGCTHFIVGRDHAGVGNYYGTYDAQKIFGEVDPAALGIHPINFEHTFWCKKSGAMASQKTTNSGPEDQVMLSGTKVREMLAKGERPPVEFTRPEIADILIASMKG